jgi:hypothetical protein
MPKIYSVFLALSVCFFYCTVNDVNAQVVTPGLKTYNAKYVSFPPTIDGIVNDSAWSQGYWESNFEDIEGGSRPKPKLSTQFKILWDSNYLYVAGYLKEPDLWATKMIRDDIVYYDNDFELFLDPNNDGENYFEFEINVLGTLMDLMMTKPYKMGGTYSLKWNAENIKYAVHPHGTINNNTDIDKGWSIEMAIPFKDFKIGNRNYLPNASIPWRLNFSRVEWTLAKLEKSYTKKMNLSNKPINEYNWVWSPTGVIDIHVPTKWGNLYFIK